MNKIILKLTFLFVISIFSQKTDAQSTCPEDLIYQTINLGNGSEALPFSLTFQFTKDSLFVYPPSSKGRKAENFLEFKVISKKCEWVNNFTEGKSEYELLTTYKQTEKRGKLNVLIEKGKGKITLLYSDSNEQRVFEMKIP